MSQTKAYSESVGMTPTPPFRKRSITGSRRHTSEPSSLTSTAHGQAVSAHKRRLCWRESGVQIASFLSRRGRSAPGGTVEAI
eukprot:7837074-Pyramimonas_sp.AAC.1